MLEGLALDQGMEIVAILIDVPLELLERRAAGRRICPVCGEIYNIYSKPPAVDNVCDLHPEATLNHRPDDQPEKIRVRLETYAEQTQPLLDYYEKAGRLHRVDGKRDQQVIYQDVEKIVTGATPE
jgi:adenylate kinase